MSTGKEKCERLRAIRKEVARQYGLDYAPVECTHTGDCSGTCPQCDEELRNLQSQLDKKGVKDVDLHVEISSLADNPGEMDVLQGEDVAGQLEGMPSLPYAMPKEHDRILYPKSVIRLRADCSLMSCKRETGCGQKRARCPNASFSQSETDSACLMTDLGL